MAATVIEGRSFVCRARAPSWRAPSGPDGRLSLDVRPDEVCLGMDAPRPRPFESGCGEVVNSEHFIEHLTREEAGRYLAEADWVCDPDGVLRTTTHNLRGFCELYLQREPDVLDAAEYGRNERELLCGTDHHGHGTLPGSVPFVDVVTPE